MATIAAVVGFLVAGSATAQQTPANCGNVDSEWTPAFNDSPTYDCDGNAGGPSAECSILTSAQSCCGLGSTNQEEKTCICAVYNANLGILNGLGITHNNC